MKRWIPLLVIAALAAGGFAGFSALDKVSAQSGTTTAAAQDVTADQPFAMARAGRDGRGGYTSEELAAALGITVDELTQAQTEARAAALAQAVEDGLLTQAQADEIASNGAAFPVGARWRGWLSDQGLDFDAFLAEALGISTEELAAARSEALDAHLAGLVTDGTLTQDQADLIQARRALATSESFQASLQSAYETALAQAVSDGTITQAQADLLLAKSAGYGFGQHAGRGHRGQ